ncbi:MAG TPA: PAAR domain-containing protein [Gemmatirosa sp.]
MPAAARVGDPITHSNAFAGLIAGVVVGAVIGAVIVGSGGAAAPLVVASMVAGGASLGGVAGEFLGQFSTSSAGQIAAGSPNVRVNGRPAAFCTSAATCQQHSGTLVVAQGSAVVRINGNAAARTGDKGSCGFTVGPGSPNVRVGGPPAACAEVGNEVPWWADAALLVLGIAGGGMGLAAKGFGAAAIALRLGGGLVGGVTFGAGGHWLGGALFGEGSVGQQVTTGASALVGGVLGDGSGNVVAALRDRALVTQLSNAGDIAGARAVLQPYVEAGNRDAIISRLDVSSPRDGAVFWSGASDAAKAHAQSIGGVTLETTPGGRVIDNWPSLNDNLPWDQGGKEFWGGVSTSYAQGASGDVSVVQSEYKAALGGGDIWKEYELPELQRQMRRGQVTQILPPEIVPNPPR